MIGLLALILRLALLAVFAFGFVVLYEHGLANFSASAKTEWSALRAFAARKKSSEPAPTPAATPEPPLATPDPAAASMPEATPPAPPTPVPSVAPTPASVDAWDALQKQPMGEAMDIPVDSPAGDSTPQPESN